MAKFYGKVGYVKTEETQPGVWTEVPKERVYTGDVIKNARRLETSGVINANVNVSNSISIVADAYAYENIFAIRYIEWMGAFWTVTDVEVQRPRLILSVGGVYNGPTC